MVTWGAMRDCQAAPYFAALAALQPPTPEEAPGPFALAAPGRLAALVAEAGWSPVNMSDVAVHWHWPDLDLALRALLAPGLAVEAMRHAGEERVRAAVTGVLEQFRRADGYHLDNKFRCLIARR